MEIIKNITEVSDVYFNDVYYCVTPERTIARSFFSPTSILDCMLYKAGKLYRTFKEAERHLDEDYKDLIIQEEE